MTTPLEQNLMIITVILSFFLVGFLLAFIKKRRQYRDLVTLQTPYQPWEQLANGTYVIPISTELYIHDTNQGLVSVGTVGKNFSAFAEMTIEEALEDAFYGNSFEKGYVSVQIVTVSSNSNEVLIMTSLGKRFTIKRSENEEFPDTVEISFNS